jgi:asparagine synthase (glutamine-hydrolysing)
VCGIAGFWSVTGQEPERELERIASRMSANLAHRGPDASGIWVCADEQIALAHTRLAIIDLSDDGNQPMTSGDGRGVLIFNGEIYNFLEIKSEIDSISLRPWHSHSDTEVLLRAIECWGIEDAVTRLVGMFAFAYFDKRHRELCLVRDRIGKKPLYVAARSDSVVFASELKGLTQHPSVSKKVDPDAVLEFLCRGYINAPRSIYDGVTKLEPGCIKKYVLVNGQLEEQLTRYWDLNVISKNGQSSWGNGGVQDVQIADLLDDAVRKRLIADVEIGTLLSGGIDSTLITEAAVRTSPSKTVKTFTIGFSANEFDESSNARAVAEYLGTEHHEIIVTPKEARDVIPDLCRIYDEPFGDLSQIPTVLVSQMARKSVVVALSGDGGDELFHGYSRYQRKMQQWIYLMRTPPFMRMLSSQYVLPAISALSRLSLAPQSLKARSYDFERACVVSSAKTLAESYFLGTSAWFGDRRILSDDLDGAVCPSYSETSFGDSIASLALIDQQSYLPGDILCKVDRASMSVGLESRSPLLDHRLIELAWTIDPSRMTETGRGKLPLWDLLLQRVPRGLVDRPKQGFGVPMEEWLRGPLREWAEELLSVPNLNEHNLLCVDAVTEIWQRFLGGQRNLVSIIWNLLTLQQWAKAHGVSV